MFMCEMITFFRHLPLTVCSSLKRLSASDTSLVSRNGSFGRRLFLVSSTASVWLVSSSVVWPSTEVAVEKKESVSVGSWHS